MWMVSKVYLCSKEIIRKYILPYTSTIYSLWLPLISYSMNSWMTWRPNSVSIYWGDSGILGIEFQKNGSGYELHQNKFVKRLIEAFPTEILKGADLPRTPDNSFKNGKHKIIDDKTGKPSKNQKDIPIPDEYIYEEIDSPSLDKEHHDLYRSIGDVVMANK